MERVDSNGSLFVFRADAEHRPNLRAHTDEARGLGIFGAPSFIAGRELFFGADRLDLALNWARRSAR